jgi:hypothetical protein
MTAVFVIATFLIPCSVRYALIQNRSTLDKPPEPLEKVASSAKIFLIGRRIS